MEKENQAKMRKVHLVFGYGFLLPLSAWYALALEKESRSIGPLGLELWPCKDGNRQMISLKFEPSGQISSIHVQTRITLAWNEFYIK